ncbi:hypothetical protein Tco_0861111 [Tanacetum coccineum]|uniref:Retrovirus-related Pol polyprotein from transposon TNT 1-94 n=1 Tax=Tanacetum coccineum TaxID=301880 RepID=A0ABQ5BKZ9_9ASTR
MKPEPKKKVMGSPKTAKGDAKPESQWTPDEKRVVVQDQRLKSIIMSCLPDDIMESVISYVSAKETWTNLVYSFEGPSDTKENRIMDLKLEYQTFKAKSTKSLSQTYTCYKTLLNELANDGINLSKHEINIFIEVTETFNWDEEEVFDEEEVTQVKVLMALADDELTVGKSHAHNGEWVNITMRKVERLNPDSKLPNFNTGRILVPESQVVNESLETSNTPESSKDSEAEFLTLLPPLKILQGASPS